MDLQEFGRLIDDLSGSLPRPSAELKQKERRAPPEMAPTPETALVVHAIRPEQRRKGTPSSHTWLVHGAGRRCRSASEVREMTGGDCNLRCC